MPHGRVKGSVRLLSSLGYLGYGGKKSAAGEMVKFASAVELMHSMLLVQDDIIDRSPLRRGEKSLHVVLSEKYRGLTGNDSLGSDIALVMADVMFSNALRIIYSARTGSRSRERFIRIFADTYERTAFGQVLDSLNSLPVSIEPMNGVPPAYQHHEDRIAIHTFFVFFFFFFCRHIYIFLKLQLHYSIQIIKTKQRIMQHQSISDKQT